MNIRILLITIFLLSFSASSCGMKRALTLPKKDGQQSADSTQAHTPNDPMHTRKDDNLTQFKTPKSDEQINDTKVDPKVDETDRRDNIPHLEQINSTE